MTTTDALAALEAWVAALEAAGDDPGRLAALPPTPPHPEDGLPAALAPHAARLLARLAAVDARLAARRDEVGRMVAATAPAAARPRPSATPRFIDRSF